LDIDRFTRSSRPPVLEVTSTRAIPISESSNASRKRCSEACIAFSARTWAVTSAATVMKPVIRPVGPRWAVAVSSTLCLAPSAPT
jgi:hypothetical protein